MKYIRSLAILAISLFTLSASAQIPDAPGYAPYKVVGHRGGAKEAGSDVPDNSIASLEYAMNLGLYGAECDIYMTSDMRVIVGHAASDGTIFGLIPREHTLEEMQSAGTLSNGETLPTLEDYITRVMTPGSVTRLILDIKYVSPHYYGYTCCELAIKIIQKMKAEKFCQFICTGDEETMRESFKACRGTGIPIAWMAARSPRDYKNNTYPWANIDVKNFPDGTGTGSLQPQEFFDAGIELSVYNIDKADRMEWWLQYYPQMKAVCTNYPKRILNYLKGKVNPEPNPDSAVEATAADSGEPTARYYNLQGIPVDPDTRGVVVECSAEGARMVRR